MQNNDNDNNNDKLRAQLSASQTGYIFSIRAASAAVASGAVGLVTASGSPRSVETDQSVKRLGSVAQPHGDTQTEQTDHIHLSRKLERATVAKLHRRYLQRTYSEEVVQSRTRRIITTRRSLREALTRGWAERAEQNKPASHPSIRKSDWMGDATQVEFVPRALLSMRCAYV